MNQESISNCCFTSVEANDKIWLDIVHENLSGRRYSKDFVGFGQFAGGIQDACVY
jgi:hypothetical protein